MSLRLASVLAFCSLAPAAWASSIFTTGVAITDPNSDCSSSCTELTTEVGSATFTLVGNTTITGIDFSTFQLAGAYNGGTLDWGIYADNSGVQGLLLGSGASKLSQTEINPNVMVAGFGPLAEYQNSFTVNNLSLDPSPAPENYFLDIWDPSGVDEFGIFWATSGLNTQAFQLDGTGNADPPAPTPEPGSLALVAIGVALLAGRHFRQYSRGA